MYDHIGAQARYRPCGNADVFLERWRLIFPRPVHLFEPRALHNVDRVNLDTPRGRVYKINGSVSLARSLPGQSDYHMRDEGDTVGGEYLCRPFIHLGRIAAVDDFRSLVGGGLQSELHPDVNSLLIRRDKRRYLLCDAVGACADSEHSYSVTYQGAVVSFTKDVHGRVRICEILEIGYKSIAPFVACQGILDLATYAARRIYMLSRAALTAIYTAADAASTVSVGTAEAAVDADLADLAAVLRFKI